MAESNQKSSDGFKLNCTMRPSNNQDDANAVLIPIEACVKELKDGRWFTSGNHGQPGIISKVKMSKTGKHGHAKFTFNVAYPFTGQNSQEMHPGHSHLTKPEVMKKEYQVTNYEDGSIECMGTGDEGEQFFSYPLEYDGSAGGPTGKNFKIMWDEVYNLDEEMDLWVQVLKAPIKKKSGAEWCFQVTSAQYKPAN